MSSRPLIVLQQELPLFPFLFFSWYILRTSPYASDCSSRFHWKKYIQWFNFFFFVGSSLSSLLEAILFGPMIIFKVTILKKMKRWATGDKSNHNKRKSRDWGRENCARCVWFSTFYASMTKPRVLKSAEQKVDYVYVYMSVCMSVYELRTDEPVISRFGRKSKII